MWGVKLSTTEPFVYSIFGLQSPSDQPTVQQEALRAQFDSLITPHATHIDRLLQNGCTTAQQPTGKTVIWLGYWATRTQYLNWWTSSAVQTFWTTLPATDAGMWREILTPDASRTQYGTNEPDPHRTGLGHLGPRMSIADKSGYWGCYRQRMAASTGDRFTTPIKRDLVPQRPSLDTNKADAPVPDGIRRQPGRVHLTQFPDNICFVVEGQDHSRISEAEKAYWFEHFDQSVNTWMADLVLTPGPDTGMLDSRLCFAPESGRFRTGSTALPALDYHKKVQLFYFKDLRHMERVGRSNKGHAALRSRFMAAYGPDGEMSAGSIGLWVETTVLKGHEMEYER
ncbi:hypothetical protein BO78DRAFT_390946 [Aspergillus sclerotiicarbonarius CBS 121057]|uniref:Phenylacetaldoxime dehydratase n=1 Tax=Aspergillus sclerotiicarbonarius (strain CBS 121057 / IBT 28362) TaxID=1448318 RepID=A0A319DZK7_ASPSB|nr:hypothetical protein BO78DRAFT_390946 [Aspergillus sclerotiicarbonarius CBS 121057]